MKDNKESFFWSLAGCCHYPGKLSHGRRILSLALNEWIHSLKKDILISHCGKKTIQKKALEGNKKDFNEVKSEKNINKYDFKSPYFSLKYHLDILRNYRKIKKN